MLEAWGPMEPWVVWGADWRIQREGLDFCSQLIVWLQGPPTILGAPVFLREVQGKAS